MARTPPQTKPAAGGDTLLGNQAARLKPSNALADSIATGRKSARDLVKTHAKERIQQLAEQIRILKKLYGANPKALAAQIARIAKELGSILKDFDGAHKGDVEDATLKRQRAEAEAQVKAAESDAPQQIVTDDSLQARRRAAGLEDTPEAFEMKDFIKEVRGFVKFLKEILQSAKIKASGDAAKSQDKNDPFELADNELRDLDESLDRAFREVDSEAKVTNAPGALVSISA